MLSGENIVKIIEAETRSAQWLASGNALLEKGDKTQAELHFSKSEYWLCVANKLRGWA
jgi:hypothetical protein